MRRRQFLKVATAAIIGAGWVPDVLAEPIRYREDAGSRYADEYIRDYLQKVRNFNSPHHDDMFVSPEDLPIFQACVKRLNRLQDTVGYGAFHLLSFDEAVAEARDFAGKVGAFAPAELTYLDRIFHEDASHYGFMGMKPLQQLTYRIKSDRVEKVAGAGNYLYKGPPVETYRKIRDAVGPDVVLTSGVRGVMKQFVLFLNKAYDSDGNLSLASRSLAPPGFSFHGSGDFDVGQVGFGKDNFTERFVTTEVFKRLEDLGYLELRYARDNFLGVRYEPWHIRVKWQAA